MIMFEIGKSDMPEIILIGITYFETQYLVHKYNNNTIDNTYII